MVVILITEKIYEKTTRYLKKIRTCIDQSSSLNLAILKGFKDGLPIESLENGLVQNVFKGNIFEIAEWIREDLADKNDTPFVIGLNETSVLPAIALRSVLNLDMASGYIEACDKTMTRTLILDKYDDIGLKFLEVIPGYIEEIPSKFDSEKYVVKPAFGMSSTGVRVFNDWDSAVNYATLDVGKKQWLPQEVVKTLDLSPRTDKQIIEQFIDGVEFSIDGWIYEEDFFSIVQHKLRMVSKSFIGDGPTISPLLNPKEAEELQPNDEDSPWMGITSDKNKIDDFAKKVLNGINFKKGVFHIEAREDTLSGNLQLIEVNPRSPGGSLWKTALYRSGYDLEKIDAQIQLNLFNSKNSDVDKVYDYVLHYPIYAHRSGELRSWGLLKDFVETNSGIEMDIDAEIGTKFVDTDLEEEPYLAYIVLYSFDRSRVINLYHEVKKLLPEIV